MQSTHRGLLLHDLRDSGRLVLEGGEQNWSVRLLDRHNRAHRRTARARFLPWSHTITPHSTVQSPRTSSSSPKHRQSLDPQASLSQPKCPPRGDRHELTDGSSGTNVTFSPSINLPGHRGPAGAAVEEDVKLLRLQEIMVRFSLL